MSAPAANQQDVPSILRLSFELTRFVLLRYETEFTPCTGITAVTKQERRSFKNGVMIAPWCPALNRVESGCPLLNGAVIDTGWQFEISTGKACRVLTTQPDGLMPIEFLAMAGHFQGYASPYDVSAEDLSCDSLAFGLAVERLLQRLNYPGRMAWGADWESVPALTRLLSHYDTVLTIHNTFDRPLDVASLAFGSVYDCFVCFRQACVRPPKSRFLLGQDAADRGSADFELACDL